MNSCVSECILVMLLDLRKKLMKEKYKVRKRKKEKTIIKFQNSKWKKVNDRKNQINKDIFQKIKLKSLFYP